MKEHHLSQSQSQPLSPRDMVICYPNEVTRIKMTFDKVGRYVWHCHILSHEDHDMMRAMYVSPIV